MNIEQFIKDLKSHDKLIRMQAAENLGLTGSKQAIEPLIHALNDVDSEVRYAVVKSLSHFSDERISNILLNLLKDSAWYVRSLVALTLERNLKDNSQSLLEFLFQNDPNQLSKIYAAFSLVILDKDPEKNYLKFILKKINDDNKTIQLQAINMLGEVNNESVIDILIKHFEKLDNEGKEATIYTLSQYKNEKVEKWLLTHLKVQDALIRVTVAKVLEGFKSAEVIEKLIESLNDESSLVRSAIAITLGNIGDEIAIQPLIERLKDSDQDVVYYSKEALNKIGI